MKLSMAITVMGLMACAAAGCAYPLPATPPTGTNFQQQVEMLQGQVDTLQKQVARLAYNTASGGGVNLKLMPDPQTGAPTVPLEEVFSFDRHHVMCRVDTNPQAFRMPTYALGEVVIEPHQFFMSMVATSIEQYTLETDDAGLRRVTLRGGLDAVTEVGQAHATLGSRTVAEHATYQIEAVDAGIGGGEAGDAFAFTVFFDSEEAPVNYAIFGPEFTFTGEAAPTTTWSKARWSRSSSRD